RPPRVVPARGSRLAKPSKPKPPPPRPQRRPANASRSRKRAKSRPHTRTPFSTFEDQASPLRQRGGLLSCFTFRDEHSEPPCVSRGDCVPSPPHVQYCLASLTN